MTPNLPEVGAGLLILSLPWSSQGQVNACQASVCPRLTSWLGSFHLSGLQTGMWPPGAHRCCRDNAARRAVG